VLSDVEAAWLAAYGHQSKGQGVLLISGTGSIAYGRDAQGHVARAGGLGPEKGDEGSAYWIGTQWEALSHSISRKKQLSVRDVAAKASGVARLAQRKNKKAIQVIQEAQQHLVALAEELTGALKWKAAIPVAFSGSVATHPYFQRGLVKKLQASRRKFQIVPLHTDPATAAIQSALRLRSGFVSKLKHD